MMRRRGGDLSGGQQQQLALGRALVLEPTLLILDEPTEGIQPNIVHEIGDILLRLNQETGLTVLLVEQKLPFARDRKSTRLNSSHTVISYAVFCLKKKTNEQHTVTQYHSAPPYGTHKRHVSS